MPGPSLISGVAGTVERTTPSPGPGTQIGQAFSNLAEMLTKMTEMKQQHGTQQMDKLLKAADMGMPIDPNAFRKAAKMAGVPLMKDSDMKAFTDAKKQGQGGQPTPSGPAPISNDVKGGPQEKRIDPMKEAQDKINKMSPKELGSHLVDQWVNRAVQVGVAKQNGAMAQAEYMSRITGLKTAALNGDLEASGKLMAAGEIPFNINQVQWDKATPEQRQGMINLAAGHESQAQLHERGTKIGESLLTSGKVKDPQAAYSMGNKLAEGKVLTPEEQKSVQANTLSELLDETKLGNELVQMGVPANKLKSTISAAQAGGLEHALPTGIKPVALQSLALQRRQVEAEESRARSEEKRIGVEQTRANTEFGKLAILAKKADMELEKAENTELKTDFINMVNAKKAGTKIDPAIEKQIVKKFAEATGLQAKEAQTFWETVTGGSHYEFTGKVDEKALGNQPSAPTVTEKVTKGAKTFMNNMKTRKNSLLGESN